MSYEKNILFYQLISNFTMPLKSSPHIGIDLKSGDIIPVIDGIVYVKEETYDEKYLMSICSHEFIKLNNKIFEQVIL